MPRVGCVRYLSELKRGEVGFRTDIVLSPLKGVKIGLIRAEH